VITLSLASLPKPTHWSKLFPPGVDCIRVAPSPFSATQQQDFVRWASNLPFSKGKEFAGRYEYHHFSELFHSTSEPQEGTNVLTSITRRAMRVDKESDEDDLVRLAEFVDPLKEMVGGLDFNDIWIQRYHQGAVMVPHQDPRSFKGLHLVPLIGARGLTEG
jgi:hypothetical protein